MGWKSVNRIKCPAVLRRYAAQLFSKLQLADDRVHVNPGDQDAQGA